MSKDRNKIPAAKRVSRKITTAMRFRPAIKNQSSAQKATFGSHRIKKDKKIQAYLALQAKAQAKQNELIEANLSAVTKEFRQLGISKTEVDDFIGDVAKFETQLSEAVTQEDIDAVIEEKGAWQKKNPKYNPIKALMLRGSEAATKFKEAQHQAKLEKEKNELIAKIETKIAHLEKDKDKLTSKASEDKLEKRKQKIENRIELLGYVLSKIKNDDQYLGNKIGKLNAKISRLNLEARTLEEEMKKQNNDEVKLSNMESELDKIKKDVTKLEAQKAALEKSREAFEDKINRQRSEPFQIEEMKNKAESMLSEFRYFNNTEIMDNELERKPIQARVRALLLAVQRVDKVEENAQIMKQREKQSLEAKLDELFENQEKQDEATLKPIDSDVDELVDKLFASDAADDSKQADKRNVAEDVYAGHLYAIHVRGRAAVSLSNQPVSKENTLYHNLKSLDRPFDDVTLSDMTKQQFFGGAEDKERWESDSKASQAYIAEAAKIISDNAPLTGDKELRNEIIINIAEKFQAAAKPILDDFIAVMQKERAISSTPEIPSDEDIKKTAVVAVRNYLFHVSKLNEYLKSNEVDKLNQGEVLRIMSMVYHLDDVTKGFEGKYKELISKFGTLDKLELYVSMVSPKYLSEILNNDVSVKNKVKDIAEALSDESRKEPHKSRLAPLYTILKNEESLTEGVKTERRKSFTARRLSRMSKTQPAPVVDQPIVEAAPFGTQWKRASGKLGGKNLAGYLGGIYETQSDGEKVTALYKQDTKDGKVRVSKLIGEGLAGALLNSLYKKTLGDDYKDRVAQTQLVQVAGQENDKSGNATYLKSVYIAGYRGDFWVFAYQERFKSYYNKKFTNLSSKDITFYEHKILDYKTKKNTALDIELRELTELKKQIEAEKGIHHDDIRLQNIEMKIKGVQAKQDKLAADFEKADKVLRDMRLGRKPVDVSPLVDYLVERKMSAKKRPSGVTSPSSRKAISEAILSPDNNKDNKHFLRDFADMTAPRLWLADFGVHNGNFGVANVGGVERLVCLDFGAAFSKLNHDVNPYSRTKTGIEPHKFYKNHFLEYDDAIIKSKEMAAAFIKIGLIPGDEIRLWVDAGIKDVLGDKFDKEALLKFAQRLGMKEDQRDALRDKSEKDILTVIQTYMKVGLEARAKSLLNQGYALLLERCYDKQNQKVDVSALQATLKEYPDLAEFARHDFRKMNLVIHDSTVVGKDDVVKTMLVDQVNKLLATPEPTALERAAVTELKTLLAIQAKLMEKYTAFPNQQDLHKLRMAHAGVLDTFKTYVDVDSGIIETDKLVIELRDEIIRNEDKLRSKHLLLTPPATDELLDITKNRKYVAEDAPQRMRSSTVITTQHVSKKIKGLMRRSAPVLHTGHHDPRNMHSFFEETHRGQNKSVKKEEETKTDSEKKRPK